jgi:N-methylhydantoinase A
VVLGRLPASRPLAGGITLSRGAALAAYQAEAGRYGGSVEAVAAGAVRVANAAMESALRRVSIEQGHDPADFTLVAFGGAGPLHACELAELLGLAAVLVPVWPGAMSALGLACSKAAATASRSLPAWPTRGLERVWRALEASALGQAGLASGDAVRLDRFADMRYRGQSWEVAVPWPRDGDPLEIFSAIHRRRYGYDRPGEPVEVVTLRVRATAADAVRMPAPDHSTRGPPVETLIQSADGPRSAPVLTRFALGSGAEVKGPALIVQDDATTYVASGWIATVLPGLELLLSRPAQDAG